MAFGQLTAMDNIWDWVPLCITNAIIHDETFGIAPLVYYFSRTLLLELRDKLILIRLI